MCGGGNKSHCFHLLSFSSLVREGFPFEDYGNDPHTVPNTIDEIDRSLLISMFISPGEEDTTCHACLHGGSTNEDSGQPETMGSKFCSIKRVRYPLVPMRECDWLV